MTLWPECRSYIHGCMTCWIKAMQSKRPVPFALVQVAGFVINPETRGKKFVEGVLVPC